MDPTIALHKPIDPCEHSPLIRGLVLSLNYAVEHGGIGLTQTGAMNRKFVTVARAYRDDSESFIFEPRPRFKPGQGDPPSSSVFCTRGQAFSLGLSCAGSVFCAREKRQGIGAEHPEGEGGAFLAALETSGSPIKSGMTSEGVAGVWLANFDGRAAQVSAGRDWDVAG
ncbi:MULTISPECIES: hypothetical protein [unclassified Roseibium]|uniref:hypothetical protein n=1 Tax=unclassified Roseibium TaxID=2629323 RepID=UPI00273D563B|nr:MULTISPECIES: hypothetical protein [unclassified Roseibium]